MARKERIARHMQPYALLLMLFAGFVGFALAVSYKGNTGAATADATTALLAPFQKTYAAKSSGMPDLVFTSLGDGVVQVFVSDKEKYFYGIIEKGKLILLEEGSVKNPTITVSLASTTLTALQYKDTTLATALQQGKMSLSSSASVDPADLLLVLQSIDLSLLTP